MPPNLFQSPKSSKSEEFEQSNENILVKLEEMILKKNDWTAKLSKKKFVKKYIVLKTELIICYLQANSSQIVSFRTDILRLRPSYA